MLKRALQCIQHVKARSLILSLTLWTIDESISNVEPISHAVSVRVHVRVRIRVRVLVRVDVRILVH